MCSKVGYRAIRIANSSISSGMLEQKESYKIKKINRHILDILKSLPFTGINMQTTCYQLLDKCIINNNSNHFGEH